MPQDFGSGDFLIFQLEAGFALLRVLARDDGEACIWHLAAYSDFFPDVAAAETATATPEKLDVSAPHLALTDRAFSCTQVAKLCNVALTDAEKRPFDEWRNDPDRTVHERSIRLLLGLR
ncbi:MAG: hypothetical protein IPM59_10850 [Chloracidobacterium sp.]|nr:hypothetical protein [Chloracidobacterium sp.]